jgi:hypothetical protein
MTDKQQPPERIWLDSVDSCRDDLGSGTYYTGKPSIASIPYARVHPVDNARDVITFTALIEVLKRLRSKHRNPNREWYEGWNAAIDCLIHDAESRTAVSSSERRYGHVIEGPSSTQYDTWLKTRPDLLTRLKDKEFTIGAGYEIWRNSWLRLREIIAATGAAESGQQRERNK